MPEFRYRCGCGWKFTMQPGFAVWCPRCRSGQVVWVNFPEVFAWLLEYDPEYRRSYRQIPAGQGEA